MRRPRRNGAGKKEAGSSRPSQRRAALNFFSHAAGENVSQVQLLSFQALNAAQPSLHLKPFWQLRTPAPKKLNY